MTVSEIMQSYCVKVNGGSGVLVNAMTKEYSYVLTAAHVIKDITNYEVTDHQGKKLQVLGVLPYPKESDSELALYDCAILKVAYQVRVAQRLNPSSCLPHRANLTLVGFPETEKESSDPIKHYDGHMTSVVNELIIFTVDGIPDKATITGMSGGGVYQVQNETPLLIGVEFQMDGTGQEQQHGRVQCHSLVRFDEIITAHLSAPMLPAYLECFSNMLDKIFSFNVYDLNNVAELNKALESVAKHLIKNGLPSPYKLIEQHHSDLLVDLTKLEDLKANELWVAYLEFLVISVLMDRQNDEYDDYFVTLNKNRRLIYTSDDSNWVTHLEKLLKVAYKFLNENGCLIIASPEQSPNILPSAVKLNKIIPNISLVPNQGPFAAIDLSENAILKSFKLTHLRALHNRCVKEVEDEYFNLQENSRLFDLLREKLSEFIN